MTSQKIVECVVMTGDLRVAEFVDNHRINLQITVFDQMTGEEDAFLTRIAYPEMVASP